MRPSNEMQVEMFERQVLAKEMYHGTDMTLAAIAATVQVAASTLHKWRHKYNWGYVRQKQWPANARFDLPGMMASKADLARESNDARASLRSFNKRALLAI